MYTIKNEFLTVTVAALGAELMSIVAADGTEYIWQADPKYWTDRCPNIFPSVGRLTDGKYRLDGNWYVLGCHGFAWRSEFEVVKHEPTYLEMRLMYSDATLAVYPRKFVFTIASAWRHPGYPLQGRESGRQGSALRHRRSPRLQRAAGTRQAV